MSLSNKAVNLLAEAITPKAIEAILTSDEWVELCMDIVPTVVEAELGEMDLDTAIEIAQSVMDRIMLRAV